MKNNPTALKSALLVSVLSLCTALSAETKTTSTTTTTDHKVTAVNAADSKLKGSDRSFFEKAAKSGMKEVSVSQSAADRLTNPQVKDFAQMMITHHTATNAELTSLAAAKGVVLPVKEMKHNEKWSKKSKGVDEDYLEEMASDHKDAIDLFEKAAKSDDAAIAAFARKTLPTLQQHLVTAKELKSSLK